MDSAANPLTVSLIVPVLNQEPRLEDVLREIAALPAAINPEVLVVYDVTRPELMDAVRAEQRRIEQKYGARCLTRTSERGFGSAIRAGFEASHGDVIIPIMGDCSDDIAAIPRMLDKVRSGADLVAGSRYMPGGAIIGDTAKQQISRFYSKIMGLVSAVGCSDVSNSFRAYRREIWETIPNEANSFDISVEMTVKAAKAGFRIDQVPAVWTNRAAGQSSFGMLKELRNYNRWLLYAARHKPRPAALILLPAALLSGVFLLGRVFGRGRA